MASVAFHLHNQLLNGEDLKLFEGCDGYEDGGQLRERNPTTWLSLLKFRLRTY
jgi:hypothetical protein